MNTLFFFCTFSQFGWLLVPQPVATGSPVVVDLAVAAGVVHELRLAVALLARTPCSRASCAACVMSLRTMMPAFDAAWVPSNEATFTTASKFSGVPPGR